MQVFEIVILLIGMFLISTLMLALIARVFGSTPVEFRTILAASFFMLIVSTLLEFLPILGWFVAIVINMAVIRIVLECSMMESLLAIVMWFGSILIVLYFADQLGLFHFFSRL